MTRSLVALAMSCLVVTACGQGLEAADDGEPPGTRPTWLTDEVLDSVAAAMQIANTQGDVPVGAAVVLMEDTGPVILAAHNTLHHDAAASGHAEINAIQLAIDYLGSSNALRSFPKERLFFVTSLEPCPMCTGALSTVWQFRPGNVAILMAKDEGWRADEWVGGAEAMRTGWVETGMDDLQLSFFCARPGYRDLFPENCRRPMASR